MTSKPPFRGERVRLGDVLSDSFSGEWGNESGVSLTPVLRTANFNSDGTLDYASPAYRYIPEKKVERKKLVRGDLILEKSGGTPNRSVGVMCYFDSDMLAVCSNFNQVLRFDLEIAESLYMFYQLRWLKERDAFAPFTRKTTGLQNLQMKLLPNLPIRLPSMRVQTQVSSTLLALEERVRLCGKMSSLLDDLVKSRFVEMFGDPRKNTKGWPEKPLGEVGTTRLGKMLDTKKQTGEHNRPYLANTDVQWFKFNLDNLRTMDFDEGDRAEYALREGDLLVTEGGEVGRCAVWHCALEECYFQKAVHRIRCKRDVLIPDYLAWTFKMKSENALFEPFVSRSTIAHLTGKKIREVPIQLPPLALQRKFADFVAEVDKSRLLVQKQIDKLQTLYDSLAQDYFG